MEPRKENNMETEMKTGSMYGAIGLIPKPCMTWVYQNAMTPKAKLLTVRLDFKINSGKRTSSKITRLIDHTHAVLYTYL